MGIYGRGADRFRYIGLALAILSTLAIGMYISISYNQSTKADNIGTSFVITKKVCIDAHPAYRSDQ